MTSWLQLSSEDGSGAPLRENSQCGGCQSPEHPQAWTPTAHGPWQLPLLCLGFPSRGRRDASEPPRQRTQPPWFGINLSRFSSSRDVLLYFLRPQWPSAEADLPGRGVML